MEKKSEIEEYNLWCSRKGDWRGQFVESSRIGDYNLTTGLEEESSMAEDNLSTGIKEES